MKRYSRTTSLSFSYQNNVNNKKEILKYDKQVAEFSVPRFRMNYTIFIFERNLTRQKVTPYHNATALTDSLVSCWAGIAASQSSRWYKFELRRYRVFPSEIWKEKGENQFLHEAAFYWARPLFRPGDIYSIA